jgi:two-component system CheB/CheR fusion protein
LIATRSSRDEIRFWVAACSSGEEAYSLAILALECMEQPATQASTIKIFATDVDRDAICGPAAASIRKASPPTCRRALVGKYFTHRDNQYHVSRKPARDGGLRAA